MTLNEYQALAMRTINVKPELHSLLGLPAEVGELTGIYQKDLQGHEDTDRHRMKEAGDILWMLTEYCTSQGWTLDEVAALNISKLKDRYPDGFEPEKSLHRRPGDE